MKFNYDYDLLSLMYQDHSYSQHTVDKIRDNIIEIINFFECEKFLSHEIQNQFDLLTIKINQIKDELSLTDDELDFIGKESIEEAISYVIEFFKIDISLEDALRKKEW